MARALLRSVLACTLAAAGCAQWASQVADTLASGTEKATIAQLVAEGGGIAATSCGEAGHAFGVDHVWVQPDALAVVVRGRLKHELRGGTLHAHLGLQKPANMSISQHLRYMTATAFTRARKFAQPLCEHLGREAGCTLPAGEQELRFAFRSLPEMVFVGKYDLKLHATDEAGEPIACIVGSLTVPEGKSRGMLRKLDTEGCPQMILDNLWAIDHIPAPEEDCENRRYTLSLPMKPDTDFYLWGSWEAEDEHCGGDFDTLWLSRRVNGLYGECIADGTCSHLPCSQVECRWCEGCGDGGQHRCEPTEENGDCQSAEQYSIHKDELQSKCYDGAPGMVASSATTRWLSSPAILLFLSLALAPRL